MIRLLWLDYYKLSLYLYLCLCLCCVLPLQKRRWQGWGVSIIRERWYVARRAMSDPPSFLLMVSLLVCPLSIFSFLPDFYLIFTWLLIVRLVCPLSTFSFLHFYSPHCTMRFPMSIDILEIHKCKNSFLAHFIVKSIHSFFRWCKTAQIFTKEKQI